MKKKRKPGSGSKIVDLWKTEEYRSITTEAQYNNGWRQRKV